MQKIVYRAIAEGLGKYLTENGTVEYLSTEQRSFIHSELQREYGSKGQLFFEGSDAYKVLFVVDTMEEALNRLRDYEQFFQRFLSCYPSKNNFCFHIIQERFV